VARVCRYRYAHLLPAVSEWQASAPFATGRALKGAYYLPARRGAECSLALKPGVRDAPGRGVILARFISMLARSTAPPLALGRWSSTTSTRPCGSWFPGQVVARTRVRSAVPEAHFHVAP